MKNRWKTGIILFIRGWAGSIIIALVIATSFKSAIADWNIVPTGSMNPTIIEGDRVFINKLAYDLKVPYTTIHLATWGAPRRGDIVVFYSPADGTRLVKRVIGLPGDTIIMKNNRLFINGEEAARDLLSNEDTEVFENMIGASARFFKERLAGVEHPVMVLPQRLAMRSFGPVVVPENSYFMMGDNRDNSADSRYFGFVDRGLIVGRATAVVISLDPENYYRPRWRRFFTALS